MPGLRLGQQEPVFTCVNVCRGWGWGMHPYPPQRRCRGKIYTERKKGWKGRLEVGRGQRPNEQISQTSRSENKNTDVHIAQLQGCMEKEKKTIKKSTS